MIICAIIDEIFTFRTQNPELVRLTGKHPFNSEARLGVLFEAVGALCNYTREHTESS